MSFGPSVELSADRNPRPVPADEATAGPSEDGQAQPSSFSAAPAFQIFVRWLILSPENCIT